MGRRRLLKEREELEKRRQEALFARHECYDYAMLEICNLEYQIACIDEKIEMEDMIYPFIITTYIVALVLLACIIGYMCLTN